MCRQILEGGRRCPCDTNEARRLRRHNQVARNQFEHERTPKNEPVSETSAIASEPLPVETGPSIETIQAKQAELEAIKDAYTTKTYTSVQLLIPAVREAYEQDNWDSINSIPKIVTQELERRTRDVGNDISELSYKNAGFTADDITKQYEADKEELKLEMEKVGLENDALYAQRDKMFPLVTNEDGTKLYSAILLSRAVKAGDEEAIKLNDQLTASNEKKNEAWKKNNNLISGQVSKAKEMARRLRDEQLVIMKTIRPLGGSINTTDNSIKKAETILKEVAEVYPSSWIEASNSKAPFRAKITKSRAHYTDGAYQKSFQLQPKLSYTHKPIGWKPDPTNRYEVGEWHETDENGDYVSPDGKMTYSGYTVPGEKAWVHETVEWGKNWEDRNNEGDHSKPAGRGWKEAMVQETKYDPETRTHIPLGLKKRWYRPLSRRVNTESVRQAELTISGTGSHARDVGLHEFAHRIESTASHGAYIGQLEETFLKRRTTDAEGDREPLQRLYAGKKEYARPDNFVDKYMGKEYTGSVYREVLSTGAEAVWGDSFGNLLGLNGGTKDLDMRNFILGVWATA